MVCVFCGGKFARTGSAIFDQSKPRRGEPPRVARQKVLPPTKQLMEYVIVFAVAAMVTSFFLLIRHWLKNV
jgi:hypothetical protein